LENYSINREIDGPSKGRGEIPKKGIPEGTKPPPMKRPNLQLDDDNDFFQSPQPQLTASNLPSSTTPPIPPYKSPMKRLSLQLNDDNDFFQSPQPQLTASNLPSSTTPPIPPPSKWKNITIPSLSACGYNIPTIIIKDGKILQPTLLPEAEGLLANAISFAQNFNRIRCGVNWHGQDDDDCNKNGDVSKYEDGNGTDKDSKLDEDDILILITIILLVLIIVSDDENDNVKTPTR
jgi:hypothetical protein